MFDHNPSDDYMFKPQYYQKKELGQYQRARKLNIDEIFPIKEKKPEPVLN